MRIDCLLFMVPVGELLTHMETSPLLVKECSDFVIPGMHGASDNCLVKDL